MAGFGTNVHLQHVTGQNTLDVQTHAQKKKKATSSAKQNGLGSTPSLSLGSKAVKEQPLAFWCLFAKQQP